MRKEEKEKEKKRMRRRTLTSRTSRAGEKHLRGDFWLFRDLHGN